MSALHKMGRLFRKLGFDKGDERSVLIGAYAMRISSVYITAALLGWSVYEVIRYGRLGFPGVLFITSQTIYWFAYCHYLKKYGG